MEAGALATGQSSLASSLSSFIFDNTMNDFYNTLDANYSTLLPGGLFLDPPTVAFKVNDDEGVCFGPLMLNMLDNVLANGSYEIIANYSPFQYPWISSMGNTLQFVVYFCLAMGAFPAFIALYPTMERLNNVRSLHYSNGLRVVPLWTSYLLFDFGFSLFTSIVCIAIFAGNNSSLYGLGYLFVVMFLYGVASILLAYVISLMAKSQLAAFAFTAIYQCAYFLVFMIAYLSIEVYVNPESMSRDLAIAHFVMQIFAPIANLIYALFLYLNLFSTICQNYEVISYYGDIKAFGGPILYLILQSLVLYLGLIWWDLGRFRISFRQKMRPSDGEEALEFDHDMAKEIRRVEDPENEDGLRISHLSKQFKKFVAVKDVSFGVAEGECFALLGPNGAGKSTMFNMIRGEISPSSGSVHVEDISVLTNRSQARSYLGVCPQFDAIDWMTVVETLTFYARLRGLKADDIAHNVNQIIAAVGLKRFRTRLAAKLSGGNRRKLSLAISLMANPSVLLLDEPSSGMDAAAKRVMWRTLASVSEGRAIVLTTHSMEEADALASRAGILATRLLAVGSSERLRDRYGDGYHVNFMCSSGVNATEEEMSRVVQWSKDMFGKDAVTVEDKLFHGQVKIVIDTNHVAETEKSSVLVSEIFDVIERDRESIGVMYYSVFAGKFGTGIFEYRWQTQRHRGRL